MAFIKFVLLAACFVAFVSNVSATLSEKDEARLIEEELVDVTEIPEGRSDRHRRVTCDLLSFGNKVQHSACAANCLRRGKAGGRCNNGVCQCRKTKFRDLFG